MSVQQQTQLGKERIHANLIRVLLISIRLMLPLERLTDSKEYLFIAAKCTSGFGSWQCEQFRSTELPEMVS
jgi:hypothetical protein